MTGMWIEPTGPCDWPWTPFECPALDTLATAGVADIVAWASSDLWLATGRLFGPCPVSVLPCNDSICGGCRNTLRYCGCGSVPEILLDGPVSSVTEVVIDGVVLDEFSYRIDDYRYLVRLDGGTWPTNADPLDPDAFRVDYNIGVAPPAGAGFVTGILACEYAKALANDETCRLPRHLREVTRQGIRQVWEAGAGFGIPEIDDWVARVTSPMLAGAVHSPDFPVIRRITWEASTSPTSP